MVQLLVTITVTEYLLTIGLFEVVSIELLTSNPTIFIAFHVAGIIFLSQGKIRLNISVRRHTQTPSCSFFQFSLLMSLVIWIAVTLVSMEFFWLKLTISVYVICLLWLQSECALLACICQEATTVGWGIPQGGPKVWPVLLAWFILSQQSIRWWKMAFYIYVCINNTRRR